MTEPIESLCLQMDLRSMIAMIDLLSVMVRAVGCESVMDWPPRRVLQSCCQMTSFWTASMSMWHSKSFRAQDQHLRTTKIFGLANDWLHFSNNMNPRGFPLESMPVSTLLITSPC